MDESTEDPRMWYVRLRIRDDRLAKLWAWKLAEHDVIVWSESEERWKQLLAVPELRAAVRKATTSAYVRKSAPPPALPPAQFEGPDSRTRRRHLQSVAEFESDELTTRVNRDSSYPDMEPTAVNQAPRSIRHANSVPPPPPLDMLRALSSTSIPPALHADPQPHFPPAPKVPSITELARSSGIRTGSQESSSASFLHPSTQSEYPAAHSLNGVVTRSGYSPAPSPNYPPVKSGYPPAPSSYPPPPSALQRSGPAQIQVAHPTIRPQYVIAKPASQFTIKNLSWAMLPVACAGVFAIFLDRYAPHPGAQPAPVVITESESGTGQLRPWLGSMLGMSLGSVQASEVAAVRTAEPGPAANQPTANLTPEQLAPVSSPTKITAATVRGVAAYNAGKGSAKVAATKSEEKDKAGGAAGNGGPAAAAPAINESFDREGARTALKFAAARVRNCSNSGVTGSALITFAPAGTVQKVQVTQMVGDDVDESCVNRALAGTRVPPFTGAPVTVRKSF